MWESGELQRCANFLFYFYPCDTRRGRESFIEKWAIQRVMLNSHNWSEKTWRWDTGKNGSAIIILWNFLHEPLGKNQSKRTASVKQVSFCFAFLTIGKNHLSIHWSWVRQFRCWKGNSAGTCIMVCECKIWNQHNLRFFQLT